MSSNEKKAIDVVVNPVFRTEDLSVGERLSFDKRVALMIREIVNNSKEYNATENRLLTQTYKKKIFAHISNNADPFTSYEQLEACLNIGRSGNTKTGKISGFQGSGMKISMFLLAMIEHAELIIHSRSDQYGSFTAKLTCDGFNDVKIERHYEYDDYIKNFYGKYYKNFNIFVSFRVTGRTSKSYKQTDIIVFNEQNMSLFEQICPSNNMKIYFIPSRAIGDGKNCKNKTYEEAMSDSNTRLKISCSQEYIQKNLSVINKSFIVKDVSFIDETESDLDNDTRNIKGDYRVDIEGYPGLIGPWGRLINLNSKNGEEIYDFVFSKQNILFKFDKKIIDRIGNRKNLDRFYNDVHCFRPNADRLLDKIGIHGFGSERDLIDKKNDYKYIKEAIKDKVTHIFPNVKITITLLDSEFTKGIKFHKLLSRYGGIDTFANCLNKKNVENCFNEVFDKLSENDSEEFINFVEDMKAMSPVDINEKLPIPIEKCYNKIYLYKKDEEDENKNYLPLRKVFPGDRFENLILKYDDENSVTEDIEESSDGFTFYKTGEETFDLHISKLSVKKNGKDKVILEEQYLKEKDSFPNKNCSVYINDKKYKVIVKCIVPSKPRVNRTGTIDPFPDNEEEDDGGCKEPKTKSKNKQKTTYDFYYSKGTEEVGKFDNKSDTLMINESNKYISRIINCCKSEDSYEATKWFEIYGKLLSKSRRIIKNYYKKCDFHYSKLFEEELEHKFTDEASYYLSTHLTVFLEDSNDVQKLIDKIEKNKKEIIKNKIIGG